MKYFLALGLSALFLFSFRKDPVTDEAAMAARYYDSISYYEDGSPEYMRYLMYDSSLNQCWFYRNGYLSKRIISWKAWRYNEYHYSETGQLMFDSTSYGNHATKRYNAKGEIEDYRMYYTGYGVRHPSIFSEQFLIDANGEPTRYITRDSLGRVTGDYSYPYKYLDGVKLVKELYDNGKTKTLGLVLPRRSLNDSPGADSVNRTGTWQTYHHCGVVASIGLYFNGVAEGLHVTFDTTGVPTHWIYYTKGKRDLDVEQQIRLDTTQYNSGPTPECDWYFLRNGKRWMEGPDVSIMKSGYIRQFIYKYNGISVGANAYGTSSYPDAAQMHVPVIAGGYQDLFVDLTFNRDYHLRAKKYEPFVTEEYTDDSKKGALLAIRKTVNSYSSYSCNGRYMNDYMFVLPKEVKGTMQFDSCIMKNDTSLFYLAGKWKVKKIRGYGYQDLLYITANENGKQDTTVNAEVRHDFTLLPNGHWYELKNTNLHAPGLCQTRVNEKLTMSVFCTDMGYSGWWRTWSPKTGKKTSEYYYEGKHATGRYRRWYENGQTEESGSVDKNGQKHGVIRVYNSDGKLKSRDRYIHGRMYGISAEPYCGCMNLRKTRQKKCKSFYWNNRKVCRLNIVCRKQKRPDPF